MTVNLEEIRDNRNKSHAFEILMGFAETPEAKSIVNKMYAGKATFNDYLHAICDGLWYGNWPWSTGGVGK
jgi:hypothetical protein